MIRVTCDRCDHPADKGGFLTIGDSSGNRTFHLCPTHLEDLVRSFEHYFKVSMRAVPQEDPRVDEG